MDKVQFFNREEALSRVRGNEKLIQMLLGKFLASEEFALLDGALEAKDVETAQAVSHAIKGLAGNLSLPALFETATTLNEQLKQGDYTEDAVQAYKTALEKTIEVIDLEVNG